MHNVSVVIVLRWGVWTETRGCHGDGDNVSIVVVLCWEHVGTGTGAWGCPRVNNNTHVVVVICWGHHGVNVVDDDAHVAVGIGTRA